MHQEGSAKGMNPVLEKHWEKIVLGVVAVIALVFIGTKFSGGGNTAANALATAETSFKKNREGENPKIDPPMLDKKPEIPPPTVADATGAWPSGTRPDIQIEAREREAAKDRGYHFPKLAMSSPKVDFDGVKLSWSLSDPTPDPAIKPAPAVVNPATFFFMVERKKEGEEKFTILEDKIKGDNFEFIDTRTEPKTGYQYQVTLGTTDPAWNAKHQSAKMMTKQVAGPVPAKTLGIWSFSFQNITAGDPDRETDGKPDPKLPTAFVTITKHDPEAGKVTFTKIVKEGETLGLDDTGSSVHSVFSPKKQRKVSVDFKSGAKITKIFVGKVVPYEYKVCTRVVNAKGELECPGPKTVKDGYRVNEVSYTDEDGAAQKDEKPDGPGKIADKLCEDHD
jgi:hypothetical protein